MAKQLLTIEQIQEVTGMNPYQICKAVPDNVILQHRFNLEKSKADAEKQKLIQDRKTFVERRRAIEEETLWVELLVRNKKAHEELQTTETQIARRIRSEQERVLAMITTRPTGCTDEQWAYYKKMLEAVLDEPERGKIALDTEKRNEPGRVPETGRKKWWKSWLFFRQQEPEQELQQEPSSELPTAPPPEGFDMDTGGSDVEQEQQSDLGEVRAIEKQDTVDEPGKEGDPVHNGQPTGEEVQDESKTDLPPEPTKVDADSPNREPTAKD